MKMNELKLIYFSPTGTTHKVVMETARSIDLKSVSFDLTIKKDLKPVAKFAPNDFRSCRISGRTLYRELYRRKTSEQGGFKRSFRIRNFTESDH